MKKIFKYLLPQAGPMTLQMPYGANVISTIQQHDIGLVVYAEVDPERVKVSRKFHIVPTGQDVPQHCRFIGTVSFRDGFYVVHVYEVL